ncbi:hypothetical protein SAMN05720354_10241 [Nitrosospira sp. Nsp1]|nr:hypothetical protein SAMN05720354_10241 [Nitrosospira sp. Nsp1]
MDCTVPVCGGRVIRCSGPIYVIGPLHIGIQLVYGFCQFQLKYSRREKRFRENRIHGLMKVPALHHEIAQQMAMVYQPLGNQMFNFAFALPHPIHR